MEHSKLIIFYFNLQLFDEFFQMLPVVRAARSRDGIYFVNVEFQGLLWLWQHMCYEISFNITIKINLYHLTLTQEHLILFVSKQIKKSFSIKYPHKVKSATKTENFKKNRFIWHQLITQSVLNITQITL